MIKGGIYMVIDSGSLISNLAASIEHVSTHQYM